VKWGGADGSVQDIPVRRLKKQGDVAWIIPMPPDAGDPILRFSTWKNETFSERMDDTGWVEHGTEESKMVRPFGGKDTCMATNIIDACGSEEDCWY